MSELDDAPRATRVDAAPPPAWNMPWACRGCMRHGNINGIIVATGAETPKGIAFEKFDRAHREASPLCIRSLGKMEIGRPWRMEFGQVVWMTFKGETGKGKPSPWPPWER